MAAMGGVGGLGEIGAMGMQHEPTMWMGADR